MRLVQRKGSKTLIMETLNQTLPPKWIQTGKQTRIVTIHVWILYSAASGNQKNKKNKKLAWIPAWIKSGLHLDAYEPCRSLSESWTGLDGFLLSFHSGPCSSFMFTEQQKELYSPFQQCASQHWPYRAKRFYTQSLQDSMNAETSRVLSFCL